MKIRLLLITIALFLLASCGGGGGGGAKCATDLDCAENEFCGFDIGICGLGLTKGSCTEIPLSCDPAVSAVCTCDGLTFFNECFAAQGAQSISFAGECP